MIANIIELLQKDEWYGAGECTEIATGQHEIVTTLKGFKRKIKREWQSRKP